MIMLLDPAAEWSIHTRPRNEVDYHYSGLRTKAGWEAVAFLTLMASQVVEGDTTRRAPVELRRLVELRLRKLGVLERAEAGTYSSLRLSQICPPSAIGALAPWVLTSPE